jgi:hypothetical protein
MNVNDSILTNFAAGTFATTTKVQQNVESVMVQEASKQTLNIPGKMEINVLF